MSKVARVQLAVIVGFVALLELLTRAGAIDRLTMIPPSAMATHLWTMLVNGELNAAMAQTFANVAIAFALATSVRCCTARGARRQRERRDRERDRDGDRQRERRQRAHRPAIAGVQTLAQRGHPVGERIQAHRPAQ